MAVAERLVDHYDVRTNQSGFERNSSIDFLWFVAPFEGYGNEASADCLGLCRYTSSNGRGTPEYLSAVRFMWGASPTDLFAVFDMDIYRRNP